MRNYRLGREFTDLISISTNNPDTIFLVKNKNVPSFYFKNVSLINANEIRFSYTYSLNNPFSNQNGGFYTRNFREGYNIYEVIFEKLKYKDLINALI